MHDGNISTRWASVESVNEKTAAIRKEMRFEDAIVDARNLTEFLHDVAFGNSLLTSEGTGASDLLFSTAAAWEGLALVHRLLAEKITVLEECYYHKENHPEA